MGDFGLMTSVFLKSRLRPWLCLCRWHQLCYSVFSCFGWFLVLTFSKLWFICLNSLFGTTQHHRSPAKGHNSSRTFNSCITSCCLIKSVPWQWKVSSGWQWILEMFVIATFQSGLIFHWHWMVQQKYQCLYHSTKTVLVSMAKLSRSWQLYGGWNVITNYVSHE